MKNHQIFIENVYAHDDAIFQVGENGSKTKFDPITRSVFGYASGDNIKHCVKEKFTELTGIAEGQSMFVKKTKGESSSQEKEQDVVYTDINLLNPFYRIWGGWNSKNEKIKQNVYKKIALKSVVEIASSQPVHPLLTSWNKGCGVRKGKVTDDVIFKEGNDKKVKYFSLEELIEKGVKSKEDADKTSFKSNFLEGKLTSRGLYKYNYVINVNSFKYCNISDVELTDEEQQVLKENGYDFAIIDNKAMLVVPTEEAKSLFCAVVDALFMWDYTANNSTHYNLREFLRCTFAHNNPSYVPMSMMGVLSEDGDKVTIDTMTDEEVKKCGIHAFTSKNLMKYHNVSGINYDIFAEKNAIENIKAIGVDILNYL